MSTLTLDNPSTTAVKVKPPLTAGQEAARKAFVGFLMDPTEQVFVLSGYSGTGKTTLVETLLSELDGIIQACKLIHLDLASYQVQLTATTNKAAENFSYLTKREVSTIQSFLGLRVHKDWQNNTSKLVPAKGNLVKEGYILFVDEVSYIDSELLQYIFRFTNKCKIIFIGDPAQLAPVNSKGTPVFDAGFKGAQLTEVVRAAEGSPITELATKFRRMVTHGESFSFTPDGVQIKHMPRDEFDGHVITEFSRDDWGYHDSKILAWTNNRVVNYNHAVRDVVKGNPNFQPGDYAVCNSYVAGTNNSRVKTDQLVQIRSIGDPTTVHGVYGRYYTLDAGTFFGPSSIVAWKEMTKALHRDGEYGALQEMEQTFIDLRAAYACTINKSQGSTYDRVFIDLDDIRGCRNMNTLARMMYVAVSRARHQVFLTGDIY